MEPKKETTKRERNAVDGIPARPPPLHHPVTVIPVPVVAAAAAAVMIHPMAADAGVVVKVEVNAAVEVQAHRRHLMMMRADDVIAVVDHLLPNVAERESNRSEKGKDRKNKKGTIKTVES